MRILTDILDVMTDGYHKSGLEAQSKIFHILIIVLTQNLVFFLYYHRYKTTYHKIRLNQTLNTYTTF